ncbi:hypothetical protein Trydic_g10854 [Trypoxylus dichotomus]
MQNSIPLERSEREQFVSEIGGSYNFNLEEISRTKVYSNSKGKTRKKAKEKGATETRRHTQKRKTKRGGQKETIAAREERRNEWKEYVEGRNDSFSCSNFRQLNENRWWNCGAACIGTTALVKLNCGNAKRCNLSSPGFLSVSVERR